VPTWEPSYGKALRLRGSSQSEVIAPSTVFPIGPRSERSRFQRSISRQPSLRGQTKSRAFQWFTGYFASVSQVSEADCRTILSGVHIRDFLCEMRWSKSLGMAHHDPHSRFISFGCELIQRCRYKYSQFERARTVMSAANAKIEEAIRFLSHLKKGFYAFQCNSEIDDKDSRFLNWHRNRSP
jgi:hypothetical protein